MRADFELIKAFEKNNVFNHIKKIPKQDNIYEYAIQVFDEGIVTGTIYLEYEVTDSFGDTVGNFGFNFQHKVFVYNIKKEGKII